MSSRVADLDLKAEKVTLAPEHAVTPPALPCARTALTRTPALAHTRTRTLLQAALLARLPGKRPLQGALARGEAAQLRRAHSAALRALKPADGERGAQPLAPAGDARRGPERKQERSGRPGLGRSRGGVTPLHPSPPQSLCPQPPPAAPPPLGVRVWKNTRRRVRVRAGWARTWAVRRPRQPGTTGGGARAPPTLACRGRPRVRTPPGPSRQPPARRRGRRRTRTEAGCLRASPKGRAES